MGHSEGSRTRSFRYRVPSLLIVLMLWGVWAPTPAVGGHDGFHRYSIARENTTGGYSGLRTTRWDNTWLNVPMDGCNQPISGHPVYQSQWIIVSGGFLEIGTGYQCGGHMRYWYWGYGNPSWHPLGNHAGIGTQRHEFRIERVSSTWRFFVDVTQMTGGVNWQILGTEVQTGIESYAAAANRPSGVNVEALRYGRPSLGWINWAGQDAQIVNTGMCGIWLSDTVWRYNQGGSC